MHEKEQMNFEITWIRINSHLNFYVNYFLYHFPFSRRIKKRRSEINRIPNFRNNSFDKRVSKANSQKRFETSKRQRFSIFRLLWASDRDPWTKDLMTDKAQYLNVMGLQESRVNISCSFWREAIIYCFYPGAQRSSWYNSESSQISNLGISLFRHYVSLIWRMINDKNTFPFFLSWRNTDVVQSAIIKNQFDYQYLITNLESLFLRKSYRLNIHKSLPSLPSSTPRHFAD